MFDLIIPDSRPRVEAGDVGGRTMSGSGGFLVVVHPGSMFGSAEHNMGRSEARDAREAVLGEMEEAAAAGLGVALIHGPLSDEIGPVSLRRIAGARASCLARGAAFLHVWGCDAGRPAPDGFAPLDHEADGLTEAADWLAAVIPQGVRVTVSGAWHDPSGESGCVTLVDERMRLARPGSETRVSDAALFLPDDEPDPSP